MIHAVRDLAPKQRQAVESLLGRALEDNEAVSLKPVWTPAAGIPPTTPEQRHEAAEWLEQHYATVAALQAARSEVGPAKG